MTFPVFWKEVGYAVLALHVVECGCVNIEPRPFIGPSIGGQRRVLFSLLRTLFPESWRLRPTAVLAPHAAECGCVNIEPRHLLDLRLVGKDECYALSTSYTPHTMYFAKISSTRQPGYVDGFL